MRRVLVTYLELERRGCGRPHSQVQGDVCKREDIDVVGYMMELVSGVYLSSGVRTYAVE
jgi:hypothetical protein